MAIIATDCPIAIDLMARENGAWVQMAPNRIVVESIGPATPPILDEDGEPLTRPDPPNRRHLWVTGLSAVQQAPIDEQVRDDQPESIVVGIDETAGEAAISNAAWVIAQLIAHPDQFAVKRRPEFVLGVSESDPTSDVSADLASADADALRAAITSALAE